MDEEHQLEITKLEDMLDGVDDAREKSDCDRAFILQTLSNLYLEIDMFQKSWQLYTASREYMLRFLDNHPEYLEYALSSTNSYVGYGCALKNRGEEYFSTSADAFAFILTLLEKSEGHDLEKANTLYCFGSLLLDMHRYEDASLLLGNSVKKLSDIDKAWSYTPQLPGITRNFFLTLCFRAAFNLAQSFKGLCDFDKAERFYRDAIAIQRGILDRDDADFVMTCLGLVEMYKSIYQYNEAGGLLDEVVEWVDLSQYPDLLIKVHMIRCHIYVAIDEFQQALQITDTFLGLLDSSTPSYCDFLYTKGRIYMEMGEFTKSLQILYPLINMLVTDDSSPDQRKELYQTLGEIYYELHEYKKSLEYYQQSYYFYEETGIDDPMWRLRHNINISLPYIQMQHFEQAHDALKNSDSIIENFKVDNFNYCLLELPVATNLGLLYLLSSQYELCENALFKALNLCEKTGYVMKSTYISNLINMSSLCLATKDYSGAMYHIRLTEDFSSTVYGSPNYTLSKIYQIKACAIYFHGHNPDEAEKMIDKAISSYKTFWGEADSVEYARLLCIKATIIDNKDFTHASKLYGASLQILQNLKLFNTALYANVLLNKIGSFISNNKSNELDKDSMDELLVILNNDLPLNTYFQIIAHKNILIYKMTMGETDIAESLCTAIAIYNEMVSEAIALKSTAFIKNYKDNISFLYKILISFFLWDENALRSFDYLLFLQNYKVGDYYLLKAVNDDINSNFNEAQAEQCKKIQSELAQIYTLSKGLLKSDESIYREYMLRIDKTEIERVPASQDKNIIKKNLYNQYWCIDYYCPEYSGMHAFAIVYKIDAMESQTLIKLTIVDEINQAIEELQNVLKKDDSTLDEIRKVKELIYKPVTDKIKDICLAKNLIICGDGAINRVPFELFTGVECNLVYVPFVDILFTDASESGRNAFVCGNPKIGKENPHLDGSLQEAYDECSKICNILEDTHFNVELAVNASNRGSAFDKSNFLSIIKNNNFTLLHLSSHGFSRLKRTMVNDLNGQSLSFSSGENPYENCGFFANDVYNQMYSNQNIYSNKDSIVTGKDILEIYLGSTRLVVLSFCESGVGVIEKSGDWIQGLQRAFLIAGADNIVSSLWPVDQESTAILMINFYAGLADGQNVNQALRNAKKQLITYCNGRYSPPHYWAGFISVGKPVNVVELPCSM